MRLSALAVLAPLVSLAAADSIEYTSYCVGGSCKGEYKWCSAYGNYSVDASNGCRKPDIVSGMSDLCLDWTLGRGHFFFDGQPTWKRCLKRGAITHSDYCLYPKVSCESLKWDEVVCTW